MRKNKVKKGKYSYVKDKRENLDKKGELSEKIYGYVLAGVRFYYARFSIFVANRVFALVHKIMSFRIKPGRRQSIRILPQFLLGKRFPKTIKIK
jgi:hypothetical protein